MIPVHLNETGACEYPIRGESSDDVDDPTGDLNGDWLLGFWLLGFDWFRCLSGILFYFDLFFFHLFYCLFFFF